MSLKVNTSYGLTRIFFTIGLFPIIYDIIEEEHHHADIIYTIIISIQYTKNRPSIDYFPASGILSNQESNEIYNNNPSPIDYFLASGILSNQEANKTCNHLYYCFYRIGFSCIPKSIYSILSQIM